MEGPLVLLETAYSALVQPKGEDLGAADGALRGEVELEVFAVLRGGRAKLRLGVPERGEQGQEVGDLIAEAAGGLGVGRKGEELGSQVLQGGRLSGPSEAATFISFRFQSAGKKPTGR